MEKKLISKQEQIKRLEDITRESCIKELSNRSFTIFYNAGVLAMENPTKIDSVLDLFVRAMEEMADHNINLEADISKGYYELYTVNDKTVENICEFMENVDGCIKCDNEVRRALAELLNSWLIIWITYRMKKANFLGILGSKSELKIVNENGVNRIYVGK